MASITSLSAITITGLVATSGIVGEVPLNWSYTTPPGQGCLSYMIPVSFEIYRGTTTSFAAGTTVLRATAPTAAYSDKGVDTTTRYYWIVAVDPNGNRSAPVGPVERYGGAGGGATTADLAAAVVDYTAKIAHEESERESADGADRDGTDDRERHCDRRGRPKPIWGPRPASSGSRRSPRPAASVRPASLSDR